MYERRLVEKLKMSFIQIINVWCLVIPGDFFSAVDVPKRPRIWWGLVS